MEDSSSPAAAANAETGGAGGSPAKADASRRSRERERKRKARELQRKKKAAATNSNNVAKGKGSVIDAEELLAQTYPKNGAADASRKSSRPRRPTEKQWTGAWPAASGGAVGGGGGGGGGGSGAVCVWSHEQEVLLAEALLAVSDESGHVDMARVYQRVRDNSDAFPPGLTNTGVYEKMRRMKYRFSAIQHAGAGAGSDQSVFRSPHEARLFQIWLRTWDPAHKQRSSPSPSPPPPPDQQQQQQGNGSVPDLSSKHISGILEGFVEALQPRLLALVDSMAHQRGPSEALITPCSVLRGCGGCSGSVGSCLMRRFEELKHEVRDHRGDLQEKRRNVGLAELKVLCQRLELLQEECKLCIGALESSSSSANPPPP